MYKERKTEKIKAGYLLKSSIYLKVYLFNDLKSTKFNQIHFITWATLSCIDIISVELKQIGLGQTETRRGQTQMSENKEKKREGVINERRQECSKTSENPSTGVAERG